MSAFQMIEIERREIARRHLESAEAWLRRIIDFKLQPAFGDNYLACDNAGTCSAINKDIRRKIDDRRQKEPNRFPRVIDAADFGDAKTIFLHPDLFPTHFRSACADAYPDGAEEARTFLERLELIRNKLAHGGACSARDLERAICYSNDLIDSIKLYFKAQSMEKQFNVPTFSRFTDNKGNDVYFSHTDQSYGLHVDLVGKPDLYVGDELLLEVEVDSNFSGYSVHWMTFNGDHGVGNPLRLIVDMKHVGLAMTVRFTVRSSEQWHRLHGEWDDMLDIKYRVLPPQT